MTAKTDDYIAKKGLEATSDVSEDRPIYRKSGFDGVATFLEMEQSISEALRRVRADKELSRAEVALLLGSVEQVYGRYERAQLKLHATQVLHLCELFEVYPDDLLFEAAPHLWGDTVEEARERRRITKMIQNLPHDSLQALGKILDGIMALQSAHQDDGGRDL